MWTCVATVAAVLRIHFTVADLARLRVAILGPFAEMQLSFTKLPAPERRPVIDSWRARTIARGLPPDVREAAVALVAPSLIHPVDLFTLVGPAAGYAEAVDRLCGVPLDLLRHEIEYSVAVTGIGPGWVGDFATADRSARHRLIRALDGYHEVAIAPYWSRIRQLLENERAGLVAIMSVHGIEAMLAELAPALHWRDQALEIPSFRGRIKDYHLNGRGLVLAPTLFGEAEPTLYLPTHDDPALLLYRIDVAAPAALRLWSAGDDPGDRALARLLGATRAAALREIATGYTTSELAQRLGISPAGASQHATALRDAGLVTSRRHRNTMRHTLTPLGAALLNAA
jgi:DNA-binding transcriptional ArsR family regulator